MAITAKFAADFSDFQSAVTKAEVSLRGFETGAGKVENSLNRMVNSFSGTKIIQDANLMSEAFDRLQKQGIGLTSEELQRMGVTANAAADKLRAMGQDVPPGIQRIADAAKGAGTQLGGMKDLLSSAAGAFGVAFSVGSVVAFGKKVFDTAGQINDMSAQMSISTDAVQGFKYAAEQAGSSLDAVGSAITKMNDNLAGGDKGTVQALKDAGLAFSDIRSMKPEDAFLAITDAVKRIEDPMIQTDVALKLFGKSAAGLLPAIKDGFRETADSAAKMSQDTIKALDEAGDAWATLADRVTIVSGTLIASTMDLVQSVTASGKSVAEFARNVLLFGAGPAANMAVALNAASKASDTAKDTILALPGPLKKTQEQLDAAAAAAKKYADAFNAMFGKFSGASATADMKMLDAVFQSLAKSGKLTKDQIDAMVKEAIKLQGEGAKLTPQLWEMARATDKLAPSLSVTALNFGQVGDKVDIVVPKLDAYLAALKHIEGLSKGPSFGSLGFDIGKPDLQGVKDSLDKINQELGYKMKQGFTDAFKFSLSGFANDLSGVIAGDMSLGKAFGNFATNVAKDFTTTALSFIPGIGPMLAEFAGPLVDGFKKLFGMGSAGRDLVKDFAESFEVFNVDTLKFSDGFDELHKQLNTLGAEGEKLWKALTQGVGKNNPEQARGVIEAITKALADQKDTTKDLAKAAEETAAAQLKSLDTIRSMMKADELTSLKSGFSEALADGFKGSEDEFLKQQLEFYNTLEEGDERLRTHFYGSTMSGWKMIASGHGDALDLISAKYEGVISKLDSEFKSLSDSVSGEAEEEFMGIVETQQRARMEQIKSEKAAQEVMRDAEIDAKQATFDAMLDAGKAVDDALREMFGKPYRMGAPEWPAGMPSGGSGGVSPRYTGPATAPGAGGGESNFTVIVPVDGEVLTKAVVKVAKRRGLT